MSQLGVSLLTKSLLLAGLNVNNVIANAESSSKAAQEDAEAIHARGDSVEELAEEHKQDAEAEDLNNSTLSFSEGSSPFSRSYGEAEIEELNWSQRNVGFGETQQTQVEGTELLGRFSTVKDRTRWMPAGPHYSWVITENPDGSVTYQFCKTNIGWLPAEVEKAMNSDNYIPDLRPKAVSSNEFYTRKQQASPPSLEGSTDVCRQRFRGPIAPNQVSKSSSFDSLYKNTNVFNAEDSSDCSEEEEEEEATTLVVCTTSPAELTAVAVVIEDAVPIGRRIWRTFFPETTVSFDANNSCNILELLDRNWFGF